jgi:GNAT superfamily N-acetyltransferase
MMPVHVRTLSPSEWPRYRDLRLRALRDAPDAFVTTLAQALERTDHDWSAILAAPADTDLPLVAEMEGVAVGLAWGKLEMRANPVCHVLQMWVDPAHRGRGAGKALLRTIVEWAESGGARAVYLTVTCGNEAAGRLYESAGFLPAGQTRPLRPGSDLLMQPMRLDLRKQLTIDN